MASPIEKALKTNEQMIRVISAVEDVGHREALALIDALLHSQHDTLVEGMNGTKVVNVSKGGSA